ncbi:hypothetical protein N7492_000178 [Penicillium capsulatum]|uniref:WW domain-containing protein n=1 Tax=Penicillium capsulatum TaxID=69766 RepID=A0A9W9IRC9_9EURO|nr:hypothetical protein N7492_000178 [Penicillium capsulatum]KAJ6130757.1 hypothetical protein N7512_003537 [Penicillium capsulatum]
MPDPQVSARGKEEREDPSPPLESPQLSAEAEPPTETSDPSKEPSSSKEEDPKDEETAPPLPDEVPPPLPNEAPPGQVEDDGWEPVWEASAQAYYFYNRFTGASQWENPRVPDAKAPGTQDSHHLEPPKRKPVLGGYNPAIHGDYDPTASYAQQYEDQAQEAAGPAVDPTTAYAATGAFNRFTGRWQADSINPENHNDENKSRRQMNAYFDVDAAANSHDGRSLRAERSAKKLSKKELKQFKEKRREKKEEKRRAWLRD